MWSTPSTWRQRRRRWSIPNTCRHTLPRIAVVYGYHGNDYDFQQQCSQTLKGFKSSWALTVISKSVCPDVIKYTKTKVYGFVYNARDCFLANFAEGNILPFQLLLWLSNIFPYLVPNTSWTLNMPILTAYWLADEPGIAYIASLYSSSTADTNPQYDDTGKKSVNYSKPNAVFGKNSLQKYSHILFIMY